MRDLTGRCKFLYGGNGGYCYSADDIVNDRCRYHRIQQSPDDEVARVEAQRDALFAEVRRLKDVLLAMEDPCGRCVDMAMAVATYRDAALKLRAVLLDLPPCQTPESAAVVDNAIQSTVWIMEPGHE